MTTAIVSAAFSGLSFKPHDYYERPAIELAEKSALPVWLFTQWQNARKFPFPIFNVDPNELVESFWGIKDWQETYLRVMQFNPMRHGLVQSKKPEILGAWLGKFEMMKRVFACMSHDALLWMDAGCARSTGLQRAGRIACVSPVRQTYIEPEIELAIDKEQMLKFVETLSAHPVMLARFQLWSNYHMPVQWMAEMVRGNRGRGAPGYGICAPFIYVQRAAFAEFYDKCRANWLRLIAAGKAGTEENAMCLYAWDNGVPSMPADVWHRSLGMRVALKG